MTVSSTENKKVWPGDGVQVDFGYDYLVLQDADLKVVLVDTSDYSETELSITTHYTIAGIKNDQGAYPNGVTITMITAPTLTEKLVAYTDPALTQEYDHVENEAFLAEALEGVYDKLTLIAQRLAEQMTRTIKASVAADPDMDFTLPLRDPGKALVWDETLKKLRNSTDTFDNVVTLATAAKDAAVIAQGLAETAQTGAETAETNAGGHESLAQEWATKAEDLEITGYPGEYSSKHHAAKAAAEILSLYSTSKTWSAPQQHAKTTFDGVATANIDMATMPTVQLLLSQDLTVNVSNWATWDRSFFIQTWVKDGLGPYYITWDANIKFQPLQDSQPHQDQAYVTLFWGWSDGSRVNLVRLADILVS